MEASADDVLTVDFGDVCVCERIGVLVWAAKVDEPVIVEVDLLEETACDVIATELELSEDSRVELAENVEETVVVALFDEENGPLVDTVVVGGVVKLFFEL